MSKIKVLQGGTLGDAHCIYCRLYRIWQLYGVEFEYTRTTIPQYAYFNKPIAEYFSRIPIVDFKGSRLDLHERYTNSWGERRKIEEEYGYDLVSSAFSEIRGRFPKYDRINCFPEYQTNNMGDNLVVIQVQGGKYKGIVEKDGSSTTHGDLRLFSVWFVSEMSKYLHSLGYNVVLIGVNDKYTLPKEKFNFDFVTNKIGETTVPEALDYVASAKCFIGFDGIFSFFAPSQRVPTLQFSHLTSNPRMEFDANKECGDGCEKWFDYSSVVRPIPKFTPFGLDMSVFEKLFYEVMNK